MSYNSIHAHSTQHTPLTVRVGCTRLRALSLLSACFLSSLALAGEHHEQRISMSPTTDAVTADATAAAHASVPPKRLVPLQANLTEVALAEDADGFDLWPCFGTSPVANSDCSSVGNPVVPLPRGGAVLGFPFHTWQLADSSKNAAGVGCDALINGTTGPGPSRAQYRPCAQIATWFEDDTFDSTDDLLQRIVVTQDERVIYDSGIVDYGPAGPTVKYPVTVILNTDANFGFWPGAAIGPNNGNCSADTNYPLTSPSNPGVVYMVEAGQTCQEPVAGPAKFTTFTALATPQYTRVTGEACTAKGVASPCYTVEWSKHDEIHQDFGIFLQ